MALGRVPVIVADDWIPFSFEEAIPYYLRVAESEIDRIPEILRERSKDSEEMGRNAKTLWDRYLSPERRVVALFEAMWRLRSEGGPLPSFEDYREKWHSKEFLKTVGWTKPQMAALRLEQHMRRLFPSVRVPGVSNLMRYRNTKAVN